MSQPLPRRSRVDRFSPFALALLASSGVCGAEEPVAGSVPASLRNQLIASGSSLAALDFDLDCVLTVRDVAVGVYLELRARDLLSVDTDGDGALTANDTIAQIRQVLAASVADPDASGVTDGLDLSKVTGDIATGSVDAASDVNRDASIDGSDVVEVGGQLGRTNVVDFDRAAGVVYAHIGLVSASIEAGTFGWHTARSEEDCGGFGGDNWPDDNTHYELSSQNYPPYHGLSVSRVFPGNHLVSTSNSWPEPDCEPSLLPTQPAVCEWPGDVGRWPANHNRTVSESWSESPDGHSEIHSFQWRNRPDHFYSVSTTWLPDHDMEISTVWPSGHAREFSDAKWGNHPESHHESLTATWQRHPAHVASLSALWPPNHRKYISQSWGSSHSGLYSMLWPATHARSTSEGWPIGIPPRSWPPNHNGPLSNDNRNALPPMPMELLPPDHTYFTTANGIFQLPFPDMPWPPAQSGDAGVDIGDR